MKYGATVIFQESAAGACAAAGDAVMTVRSSTSAASELLCMKIRARAAPGNDTAG
jgi:hypothetical protein